MKTIAQNKKAHRHVVEKKYRVYKSKRKVKHRTAAIKEFSPRQAVYHYNADI